MPLERSRLDELRIERPHGTTRSPAIVAIAILGFVVLAALTFWFVRRPSAPHVQLAAAVEESGSSSSGAVLNASGYVTARRQATVASKVTGKVIEVRIEEGMEVREGDVLARIDASQQSAGRRLAEAQVAAAASALEETRVRIAEAQLDLQRADRLSGEKVASQQEADRARATVNALRARLAAQSDELQVARRQLGLRDQDVDDTVIRAPFSGIVVSKNAQAGEIISPMSAGGGFTRTGICTIVDMSSLEVEVDVSEAYINRVKANQPVSILLDAYPDWRIPGHVIAVIPAADRQKATVRVRIAFDQRDARILPDMGVKVAFEAQQGSAPVRMVSVPRSALQRDGEKDVVFVVTNGKAERRAVVVASAEGDKARIASGVTAGEMVVASTDAPLKDGLKVRVTDAGEKK